MKIRKGVLLPNLITLGNGVCGFAAIVKLLKIQTVTDDAGVVSFQNPEVFTTAAWIILLGMVFDVFDGQVARLSGKTSDLGAQLDSFCDLLTFGLAPALLVVRLNMIYAQVWQNVVWFFCLAYFVGATLRLARFNMENDHQQAAHLCFKGLPTPAAAGCVASSVLFYRYVIEWSDAVSWVPFVLPVIGSVLGFTMVSNRLKFDHVASQILNRHQSFDMFVYLIFGGIVVFIWPEILLPLIFLGYLMFTPTRSAVNWVRSRRQADSPSPLGSASSVDALTSNRDGALRSTPSEGSPDNGAGAEDGEPFTG